VPSFLYVPTTVRMRAVTEPSLFVTCSDIVGYQHKEATEFELHPDNINVKTLIKVMKERKKPPVRKSDQLQLV
jgi:hypothetical protein